MSTRSMHREDLTEMRHKANPPVLDAAIKKHLDLLKDAKIAAQYMEGGDLEQLVQYADSNTAVVGYILHKVFDDQRRIATTIEEGSGVREEGIPFPKDCKLYVSIKVYNLESTEKTFSANTRFVENEEGTGHKKSRTTGTEWTGYGANLDVEITLEFRPGNMLNKDMVNLHFNQHLVIEPDRERRTTLQVLPPAAQEFAIGAVVDLLHDNKHLTDAELRSKAMPTELDNHFPRCFPRHNASVQNIERGLGEMGAFVDMIVHFLASLPPFRAACSRQSLVTMPWGPARKEMKKKEKVVGEAATSEGDAAMGEAATSEGDAAMGEAGNGDAYIGDVIGNALDKFHSDQCRELVGGMGVLGDLMQQLLLLKNYATHFRNCYASIDHYMVRSFMQGIGEHNATLFEKGQPLDPLLAKIALFKASRAGVEVSNAEIDITGCSVDVEIKMPGNVIFEPLKGIPSVKTFNGKLCFGGIGSKGIPVAGVHTRQVFVLPTGSDGGAKPEMRVKAQTEYANTPVIVVIGTPDGNCTTAKTTFLLVDTWCMQLAIKVGTIPSNKAFRDSMCILPPEMADFAKAIRACDMAEGGLDLHVINLRPLLASALCIDEGDLMGDPDWMTQIVGLMRGGVSLQTLAQTPPAKADVASPKYNLNKMKEVTAKLEQRMFVQGAIDHYTQQTAAPQGGHSPPQHCTSTPYNSLCADDVAEEPEEPEEPVGAVFRGAASSEKPAPKASAPTAAADSGGGDASIEALTEGMKDMASDDSDFMATLLEHSEKMPNSKAVLGASLTIPDCATSCKFAKGKLPAAGKISDFMAPSDTDKWEVRPNLNAASKTIQRMLRAYAALGKPVPTTRLTVWGLLIEWERELLKQLMGGLVEDPTKNLLGAFLSIAELQKTNQK